jgi:cell wall-associated NlpC family hydrolase
MTLDKRLNAYRDDLADKRLEGKVSAQRYVDGRIAQIREPVAGLHKSPDQTSMQLSQVIFGERLRVFDEANGFAFVQLERDRYVGYVASHAISFLVSAHTHRVAVPSTLLFPKPDLKSTPAIALPMNAAMGVADTSGDYAELTGGGFVWKKHLTDRPPTDDFVTVAQRFLNVPYLWGGKTFAGLDCSGLVQTALHAVGKLAPRDSDMQESDLGQPIAAGDFSKLRRGDLVFWKGHVGIMEDATTLLHANGFHMMVAREPLQQAVERIARNGSSVTSIGRL